MSSCPQRVLENASQVVYKTVKALEELTGSIDRQHVVGQWQQGPGRLKLEVEEKGS